jgi:ammonia channel protein AmtB
MNKILKRANFVGVLAATSVAVAVGAAACPLHFPSQLVFAGAWLVLVFLCILGRPWVSWSPFWLLGFAPLALGKSIIGVALYSSCAFNYPAGCP